MNYSRTKGKSHIKRKPGIGYLCLVFVLICSFWLGGCSGENKQTQKEPEKKEQTQTNTYIAAGPESFDSADTAILIEKNTQEQTLTFLNMAVKKYYTLSYDGTTHFYDKHQQAAALSQINVGEIVDVTFLKDKKHLTTMSLSEKAWTLTEVTNYDFDLVKREVSVGKDIYKLADIIQFLEEDQIMQEQDLNYTDVLCLYGIDTTVYSVRVSKGHGYLRLVNDENFVGGWIEIGSTLIQEIVPNMLLTVTEGAYKVTVSNNGNSGVKDVVINRNAETVVDLGDIKIEKPKEGMVIFSLTPSYAKLYVDGELTETDGAVTMEYGLHQLIVKADGYKTITQYIRVGQEKAGVEIVLEEEGEEDEEESSDSNSEESEATTAYNRVFIDAPSGVEVYLDNSYVGTTPCNFPKKAGSHVIILRKEGFVSKTYTIVVEEDGKDISYSFADLVQSTENDLNSTGIVEQLITNLLSD